MKKLTFGLLILFAGLVMSLSAQENPQIATFQLKNGLKVTLAEEHSSPKIYGGMVVHAGSKNEDPNITGVAHYFEHMMFKGTDRIGTVNWAEEKLYLDSISHQYDLLHATKDEAQRALIQKEINRLNIKASAYAIPNEVDAILSKIGCTGVNAGTSYDYTVYYNTLPSNQLETWMDIYIERFRNPIFRLFQSELEAVYEEKNMYEDSPGYPLQTKMLSTAFGEHPYSRPVIGLGEHLKNPQPSEMRRFFNNYYVANNMELILVGDFKIQEVRPLIEKKFSALRSGKVPQMKRYEMPKFESQVVENVKLSPIPLGMICMPGIPTGHPDEIALSVIQEILCGGNGLLDKLMIDNKLMMAAAQPLSLEDGGANLIIYAPKLIGQSHQEAEELIWDCIEQLKEGKFSDDLLQSIKTQELVERKRQTENLDNLSELMLGLVLNHSSYERWVKDNERLQQLTKHEIMDIARKYFTPAHCTIIRSKMGFPQKEEAVKPDWEHLQAQNVGKSSDYATRIYSREIVPTVPQVINKGIELREYKVNNDFKLYGSRNLKNDVFELKLHFNHGTMDNPDLERALGYFNLLGAGSESLVQFSLNLAKLGGDLSVNTSSTETVITITGLDENIEKILQLVEEKFRHPRHDEKQIQNILNAEKASEKQMKNDAQSWFSALREYVCFGEKSSYLSKTPLKEWKKRSGRDLMDEVNQIFNYDGYVTYTGNFSPERLCEILRRGLISKSSYTHIAPRARKMNLQTENVVYLVSNKSFGQSNIAIYTPSEEIPFKETGSQKVFNDYFGGGMNSLIFQEIREFRSLGYSTYGTYQSDPTHTNKGMLFTYLGTQCDKTLDGIQALLEIQDSMPVRPDKFNISKDFILMERNQDYISFRDIPENFRYWNVVMGKDYDFRPEITAQASSCDLSCMMSFYEKYIQKHPHTIIVSGNSNRFNKKELSKYGKVIEVKAKDIMKF